MNLDLDDYHANSQKNHILEKLINKLININKKLINYRLVQKCILKKV